MLNLKLFCPLYHFDQDLRQCLQSKQWHQKLNFEKAWKFLQSRGKMCGQYVLYQLQNQRVLIKQRPQLRSNLRFRVVNFSALKRHGCYERNVQSLDEELQSLIKFCVAFTCNEGTLSQFDCGRSIDIKDQKSFENPWHQ